MRLFFIILLFPVLANAQTFYVSNDGNDSNDGLTTSTTWRTIAKVNETITDGDVVIFKKGDSWSERLNTSVSNVSFGAYGTGAKPNITGLELVTGFTNVGNIWTASIPNSVTDLNTVIVNGILRAKARTPNSTYYTFTSVNSTSQITTSLTGTPNYTGYGIVVSCASWIIDRTKIASQSGGVLTFVTPITYDNDYGRKGFFFQNNVSDLDVEGEYVFDSTAKTLKVYSTTEPTVYISTIDTLIHVRGDNNTFDGLSFTGANKAAFQLDTANHITIENSSINYSGALGISALKSTALHVLNDSIQNCLSGAIYARQVDPYTPMVNTCDSAVIEGNYLKNTAIYKGMGMNSNGRYYGMYVIGLGLRVANNKVLNSGYLAIYTSGKKGYIYRNYIDTFGLCKSDGGGIYSGVGYYLDSDYNDSTIIRGNIIKNGLECNDAATYLSQNSGIFLDDQSRRLTVDSNTIYNCYQAGIKIHIGGTNCDINNNTIVTSTGDALAIQGDNVAIHDLNIKRNIFYNANTSWKSVYRYQGTSTAVMDSNYFSRPSGETNNFNRNETLYSLAGWKSVTGQDTHSAGTPLGVTADEPLFYDNPSLLDTTIALMGRYRDLQGFVYNGSVTLAPSASVLLYKLVGNKLYTKFRTVRN